jgi:hypothetical protein
MRNTIFNFRKIITFFILFAVLSILIQQSVCADEVAPLAVKNDYGVIAGDWQRTDGNYVIKVTDVPMGGHATVEYFNPKSIQIEQASVSTEKELIKLFIKFQDKGYEGSTYRLYYFAKKDALVGFYYQAVMDKTFEVIFLRKTQ